MGARRFSLPSLRAKETEATLTGEAIPVIVMVEDNVADVRLVREALDEHAVLCELEVISDGEEAIAFFDSVDASGGACPQLVILDLNLPKRSGADVLRHLRASKGCGGIPIIVMSSSDNQKDRDTAAALGASQYVRKPSRLDEFMKLGELFKEMLSKPK